MVLGHDLFGSGAAPVIVLNDWMCDTSTWDGARTYLDTSRFTWAFTDLRGYGRSRDRRGAFDLFEAAADVVALAEHKGWSRFSIVGHSMSTLIALHLAQHDREKLVCGVLVTPPPPTGFGFTDDDPRLEGARALARDDAMRSARLKERFGTRLSPGWSAHKAARWRETADPEAASAYVAMFACNGLPTPCAPITIPMLAITGEQDLEPMRAASARSQLSPICERLTLVPLAESGHYPMQEMPPLFVAHLERFLTEHAIPL